MPKYDIKKLTAAEKNDILEKLNDIIVYEEMRDTKKAELDEFQNEAAEQIAGYKETIREFDQEIKVRWNDLKTGQYKLNLELPELNLQNNDPDFAAASYDGFICIKCRELIPAMNDYYTSDHQCIICPHCKYKQSVNEALPKTN